MTLHHDLLKQRATDRLRTIAVALEGYALEVEKLAKHLDNGAFTCDCCGANRWRNWPQKGVRDRIEGAAESLRNIGETIRRRAADPDFIGEPAPTSDVLLRALAAVDNAAQDTKNGDEVVLPSHVVDLVEQALGRKASS